MPSDNHKQTDAIVVWTGGGCRVATGLELLASGISNKLFISGVYRDAGAIGSQYKALSTNSSDMLLIMNEDCQREQVSSHLTNQVEKLPNSHEKGWQLSKTFQKSCHDCRINLSFKEITLLLHKISIGHQAKTTIGNAIETARWAKLNQAHSIRLVTSPMHIPRSLVECRRYLSDIQVIVHPVEISKFNHLHWYRDWRIAYKVAIEYSKYLSILMGFRIQRKENLYDEKEEA